MTDELVILHRLKAHVAAATGCDPKDVQAGVAFAAQGVDSVAAVSMAGEIEEWLSVTLPDTLAWDFPTPKSLAAHLARLTGECGPPGRVAR
jgi:acyl carrier protein